MGDGAAKDRALQAAQSYQPSLALGAPWHLKPTQALGEIQCASVEGGSGFPHWSCVERSCKCCPAYPIPPEEQGEGDDAPCIKFHVYEIVTTCSHHGANGTVNAKKEKLRMTHILKTNVGVIASGAKKCDQCSRGGASSSGKPAKIRSRKELTLRERPIGAFLRQFYLPALERLAYHRPHTRILGKEHCGAMRLIAHKIKPSVRTRRDYAERLGASFSLEVQSSHFGNGRSLSMEGSSVETFVRAAVEAWTAGTWEMDEKDLQMVFHSHFSNESRQDSRTTHAHMTVLFQQLKEIGELCAGMVVWDDTDGCAKQYRCGTAIYLLSVLAVKFDITIDRAIGAPGHGKDIVDALNATDKVYLRHKMCMIGTPEANDGSARMAAHAMVEGKPKCLATECARLCSLPERVGGVKSEGGKRAKREAAAKVTKRVYHVQDPKEVKYTKLNYSAVGFKKGEHNGLIAHYNVQVSRDLGVGTAAVRKIPCDCVPCLRRMALPWLSGVPPEEQPRYASSTDCVYWPIFKQADGEPGINDWRIIHLKPGKDSDAAEEEEALADALAGVTAEMAAGIRIGKYGAFATLDEDADGYYVVEWTSEPYTLQEDIDLEQYDPPIVIKSGELVCDAEFFNKVPGAKLWYTKTEGEDRKVVVRVKQVVASDLTLDAVSSSNKLPSGLPRKTKTALRGKEPRRVDSGEHELILDEICRREVLEHSENDDDSSDEEGDAEAEEEEEEEEEEEGEGE